MGMWLHQVTTCFLRHRLYPHYYVRLSHWQSYWKLDLAQYFIWIPNIYYKKISLKLLKLSDEFITHFWPIWSCRAHFTWFCLKTHFNFATGKKSNKIIPNVFMSFMTNFLTYNFVKTLHRGAFCQFPLRWIYY